MDFEQNVCVGATMAASCVPLGEKQHALLLPVAPVRATATIVMLQLRFLHTNTGIQTAGTANSEQAFVTAVLEPVLPSVENQRPAKTSRIVRKNRSATEILAVGKPGEKIVLSKRKMIRERFTQMGLIPQQIYGKDYDG